MNKKEFISQVAATSGLSHTAAVIAVDAFIHVITCSLQQKNPVVLTGFGTFSVKERPARMGLNPRTGARIEIAPHTVVRFKPSQCMKELGAYSGHKTTPSK